VKLLRRVLVVLILASLALPAAAIMGRAVISVFGGTQPEGTSVESLEPTPVPYPVGPELLQNSGFELQVEGLPDDWQSVGNPRFDVSGQSSHTGLGSVQAIGDSSIYRQPVAVEAGKLYHFSLYARSTSRSQWGQLEVEWRGADGKFVSFDRSVYVAVPTWKRHDTLVQAPTGAASAVINTVAYRGNSVWIDDISFAEVLVDSKQ
jgi:hypothetical protein